MCESFSFTAGHTHTAISQDDLNRPNTHTQPPEPLSPRVTSDGFWTCSPTTAARGIESSPPLPSSRRNTGGMELSRHSQPPCPALPLADCGKTRVEVSSIGADVGRPRRAIPSEASHPSPLSVTPSEDSRWDQHEAQSMWSRVTSVSRRGLARIYGFLTRSRMSGSINEAAHMPLTRDRWTQTVGNSPPLPLRGEGCVPARSPSEPPQGGWHPVLSIW